MTARRSGEGGGAPAPPDLGRSGTPADPDLGRPGTPTDPALGPPGAPFARLEHFAAGRAAVVLMAVWAFAEAIAFPVVPDVGLLLLALVAPRRTLALFLAVVIGSLAGSAVLYVAALAAPDTASSLLLGIPGINQAMLSSARAAVAAGDPLSIAGFGPGTPLKVFTVAWATGPATPLALAAGVVLNRVTRIGPVLVACALLGWLAPALLRRLDRWVLLVYAAVWVVVYALYLGAR